MSARSRRRWNLFWFLGNCACVLLNVAIHNAAGAVFNAFIAGALLVTLLDGAHD